MPVPESESNIVHYESIFWGTEDAKAAHSQRATTVFSICYNKIPCTGWFKLQTLISGSWKVYFPKVEDQGPANFGLGEGPFPPLQASCCVLTWPFFRACTQRARSLFLFLSGHQFHHEGPVLMT